MEDKSINILVVDDDEVDIMNIKRAFKKRNINHPLYIASNGLEALAMMRSDNGELPAFPKKGRLILLDINMPKMNGLEFLEALRSNPELANTPVIVLTTSDEDQDKIEAYHFNVAGYILKPVTFDQFLGVAATLNQYWMLNEIL